MALKEYAAEGGTAIAEAPTTESNLLVVPLLSIVPSLTNPRKNFNAEKLAQLADSIKVGGVRQPVLVRPLPGTRLPDTFDFRRQGAALPIYELVAGERRYRASRQSGATTIPVMVQNLTDDEVLEIQLSENLLRDDLTPMEEAEGFRNWMEHSNLTAQEVADRVKKSLRHVYNHLSLLKLCPEARDALMAKTITVSHALPIAHIPDGKLQLKALAHATTKNYNEEFPSVRDFERWVKENVMKRLAEARFDINDTTLHTAGACTNCPKRTGANPDIFANAAAPDICTDAGCYEAKAETHTQRVIAIAQKKGLKVIEGKEAKAICTPYSSELKGYSRLDQRRGDALGEGSAPTLRELLGEDGPKPVLIEDPRTKELIEAVPTAQAEKLLVEQGRIASTSRANNPRHSIEAKKMELQSGFARTMNRHVRQAVQTAASHAIHGLNDKAAAALLVPELVRAWLVVHLTEQEDEEVARVLNLPADISEEPDRTAVMATIQAASDARLYKMLACMLMHGDDYVHPVNPQPFTCVRALAPAIGIDVDAIEKATIKARNAELKAAIRQLEAPVKAKAPKDDLPLAPAAQASTTRGKAKGKKTEGLAAPDGAKPTLKRKATAQEAMEGIATAMQGIEASALADAGQPAGVAAAGDAAGDTAPGSAAALQGIEAVPVAGALSPAVDATLDADAGTGKAAGTAAGPLDLGHLVQVNESARSPRAKRFVGKVGTIESKAGPDAWFVEFPGKKGAQVSDCSFHTTELQTPVVGVGLKVKVIHFPIIGSNQKYYNKTGTVQEAAEGGKWSVIFPGKLAIYGTFAAEDLEVVL